MVPRVKSPKSKVKNPRSKVETWDLRLRRAPSSVIRPCRKSYPHIGYLESGRNPRRITHDNPITVTLSKPARLHVELLDVSGRAVALVRDAFVPAGEHLVTARAAADAAGQASGLFTLRVRAGGQEATYKVVMAGE